MTGSNKEAIMEHLKEFGVYDLERLQDCFKYELTLKNADKAAIAEIIACIQGTLVMRRCDRQHQIDVACK